MNGVYCSSRPMRVSVATDRNGKPRVAMGQVQYPGTGQTEEEGANTTVFVGGLDASTTDEDLRARFAVIGDVSYLLVETRELAVDPNAMALQIVSVKVPPGRGCGFVQYTTKDAAEVAITQMNGAVVGGVKIRCAWGRSAAARALASSGNATAYYQQGYGSYQQPGYQNYYAQYGGASYYPQQYQQQAAGYGGYAAGYANYGQQQQHAAYQQHYGAQSYQGQQHGHQQQHQAPLDFTRPDDVEAMNRRYASQRAYQV